MKKKFSLWLNIATICLCICAIAVGVYSAQQATLNVTGQVGFTAHDCDVYVYGTASGAVDASENAISPTYGTESAYINVHDDTTGWNMGAIYFNDIGAETGKNAVDIVITLQMYNESKFDVKATFNTEFISSAGLTGKVTATPSSSEIILPADKTIADFQTMTITLVLETAEDFDEIAFNGEVLVNFTRYEEQRLYIGTDDDAGKLMMKMGHGTEKDNATDVEIEWYAFAVKGSYEETTATAPTGITGLTNDSYHIIVTNNTDDTSDDEVWYSLKDSTMTIESAKGHTFWFIQKYVVAGGYKDSDSNQIEGVYFNNDTTDYKNMYKSDTDTSDIYTYVTGDYLTETGISSDSYYKNKIATRSVEESYTGYNSVITDKTVKFSSKLWLISTEEITLLCVDSDYGYEDTNTLCAAYGIGNVSSAGMWWLRSDANSKWAFYVLGDIGRLRCYYVNNTCGVRPAFQIQI